jgi:hypothetical protein
MILRPLPRFARVSMARLCLIQGVVVVGALMVCVLMPRPQQPMLLVPLFPAAHSSATHWAFAHDMRVLGRGRLPGSLVVQSSLSVSPMSALFSGAVVLAVPGLRCDSQSPAAHPPLI